MVIILILSSSQWLATLLRPATELSFLFSMEEANKVIVFLTGREKLPEPRHYQPDFRLYSPFNYPFCLRGKEYQVWVLWKTLLAEMRKFEKWRLWETELLMVNDSKNWLLAKAAGALMTVCEVTAQVTAPLEAASWGLSQKREQNYKEWGSCEVR